MQIEDKDLDSLDVASRNEDETKNIDDQVMSSEKKVKKEEKKSKKSSNFLKSAAIGAIAIGAMTHSSKANASIEDTINQLTEKFKAVFDDMLGSIMATFAALLAANQNENASKQSEASARAADNITKAIREVEVAQVQRATAPPPDFCESDALGQDVKMATKSAQDLMDEFSKQSVNTYMSGKRKGNYSLNVSSLTKKMATSNSFLSLGNSLTSDSLESKQNTVNALSSVEIMTASAMDDIELIPSEATSDNQVKRLNYLTNSGKAIRLEIAKSAFFTSISERAATSDSKSKIQLINSEVERTYNNASWRDQLNSYADPTPLLIELNKLQAFSNYTNVEMLKKLDQQNLLIATQTISQMSH